MISIPKPWYCDGYTNRSHKPKPIYKYEVTIPERYQTSVYHTYAHNTFDAVNRVLTGTIKIDFEYVRSSTATKRKAKRLERFS